MAALLMTATMIAASRTMSLSLRESDEVRMAAEIGAV
jgi:hypothetical protein